MSQLYLISYDLSCDKLRKKCSDLCLNAGLKRVQLSVFCGALSYAGSVKMHGKNQTIVHLSIRLMDPQFLVLISNYLAIIENRDI